MYLLIRRQSSNNVRLWQVNEVNVVYVTNNIPLVLKNDDCLRSTTDILLNICIILIVIAMATLH